MDTFHSFEISNTAELDQAEFDLAEKRLERSMAEHAHFLAKYVEPDSRLFAQQLRSIGRLRSHESGLVQDGITKPTIDLLSYVSAIATSDNYSEKKLARTCIDLILQGGGIYKRIQDPHRSIMEMMVHLRHSPRDVAVVLGLGNSRREIEDLLHGFLPNNKHLHDQIKMYIDWEDRHEDYEKAVIHAVGHAYAKTVELTPNARLLSDIVRDVIEASGLSIADWAKAKGLGQWSVYHLVEQGMPPARQSVIDNFCDALDISVAEFNIAARMQVMWHYQAVKKKPGGGIEHVSVYNEIQWALRQICERKGWSARELGEAIGVDKAVANYLLSNPFSKPRGESLAKTCAYLRISKTTFNERYGRLTTGDPLVDRFILFILPCTRTCHAQVALYLESALSKSALYPYTKDIERGDDRPLTDFAFYNGVQYMLYELVRDDGWSTADIAENVGVSKTVATNLLHKIDIKTKASANLALQNFLGMEHSELAAEFNRRTTGDIDLDRALDFFCQFEAPDQERICEFLENAVE